MTLDLSQLAAQVSQMAARLQAGERERAERLAGALEVFRHCAADPEPLRRKAEVSRTTWLVAGLGRGLGRFYEAPSCPQNFLVLAADGSHIDIDPHSPARCYLINIGGALLRYGESADALLFSEPTLYAAEEEGDTNPAFWGNGALLGVKRFVEECRALARLAATLAATLDQDLPALALADGSLILWGLAGRNYPRQVREELLERGLLKVLDEIREVSQRRRLALASYISLPQATEVVNALRLALCPHEPADCDLYCPRGERRECDGVAGLQDRHLFQSLLGFGQRSTLFSSASSVVRDYREHQVCFFYLNVGEEIARVEVPRWVAEEEGLLDLLHALLLDQCWRGQGYPVALAEAHEKAVLTAADREGFHRLVEGALEESRLPTTGSAKARSKRTRWI